MRPLLPLALLLALSTVAAQATAPRADGAPDAEPSRLYAFDPAVQADLQSAPAWSRMIKAEGVTWAVRFDQATGAPLRMWGAGVAIDPSSSATVERDLRALLDRHPDALRARTKELGPARASFDASRDTWYVDLPATRGGLPIYRGAVTARIVGGRLVLLGVSTYADTPLVGRRALSPEQAVRFAIDDGPVPAAEHQIVRTRELWLPRELDDGALVLHRAFEVTTRTTAPHGRWVTFVDAATGEILHVHDELRWFDGGVEADVNLARAGEGLTRVPLTRLRIRSDAGGETLTDDDGAFELAGSRYTADLRGPDVRVVDADRRNTASLTFDGGIAVFDTSVATQPELDNYVAVRHIRDWGQRIAPDITVGDGGAGVLTSNVNRRDGNCNAFYDGQSINFFRQGGRCVNTAQLADVTWHEWGHGFHANSLRAGVFDGSISEGAADTIAFLNSDDNIIGRGFFGGQQGIRDVDNDRTYPRDVVNQVHTDGLILGGSLWELIGALEPTYGREGAQDVVGRLLAGALKGGPTLATVGEELLFADDDDGDLSNGTPHYCELSAVLGRRGLLPALAPTVAVEHEQVVDGPARGRVELRASANAQLARCVDLGELQAVYRVDGGEWRRTDARVEGEDRVMDLPELPFGSFVEYYLETDSARVPAGGFTNPLSLYVGGVLPLVCEDFEDSDGGYTSELLSGEERPGANDWQWDWPRGRGGDPFSAYSGRNVWGNDLGGRIDGQRYDGQYQPFIHNRLTSPSVSFPDHYEGVFLRYARWLTAEDGARDSARILADGEIVWTNHDSDSADGREHHLDARWVIHSVDLGETSADGSVWLAWEIQSDGEQSFGGWTIDDVCLVAPASPNNRLAIVDLRIDPTPAEGVALRWTHPKWAPVREVVVVRTEGEPPTGPDDGIVVFRTTDPALEAEAVAVDLTSRDGRSYWYAVYAGDGEDWLNWTVEGRNLVQADGVGGGGVVPLGGGCACTSSPSPLGWLALPLGLLALLRRRR